VIWITTEEWLLAYFFSYLIHFEITFIINPIIPIINIPVNKLEMSNAGARPTALARMAHK